MYGFGLSSGLRALTAARLNIQTVGHNVANANTPGFTRQRVNQSSTMPFFTANGLQIGTGVQVDDIERLFDAGLERRLGLQLGLMGAADTEYQRFQELEGLLSDPGTGLSETFGDFFGRVSQLQTNPADRALRGGVIQAGNSLAQGFNLIAGRIGELEDSGFAQMQGLVREVNENLAAIAELNGQIPSLEANGTTANDLRDQRERHVKVVAELIDARAIERSSGSVDLLIDGHLLVANDKATPLVLQRDAAGGAQLTLGAGARLVTPDKGRIAALLADDGTARATTLGRLDALAYNLALEFNRIHTTGVSRPLDVMTSFYGSRDGDGDGVRGDELLAQGEFPFPITAGELFVSVTNEADGNVERSRISIDPASMTLQDLAAKLSAVDHLTATVEPTGKLRITSESGYGFDFANRLDPRPDTLGTFGGAAPGFASNAAGPFDLSAALATPPATFVATIDGTPQTVSLDASEFANASAVTADELAAAINTDLSAATAANVGGRIVVRSNATGSGATMSLTDGTGAPLAALGLAAGTARTGQDSGVQVDISGRYTGSDNGKLVFVADSDGEIGVTDGLTVSVYDTAGTKVGTLNVGRGEYSPGEVLEVGDGVSVSFGPGSISGSTNDVFALDTLADSDTSDVLVALGLGSFFHGNSAADLTVNQDLLDNPDLFTSGRTGAPGDASNLERMMELRTFDLGALSGQSFEDHYEGTVADLGFETASARATLEAQEQLFANLEAQRAEVSGVNLDEEMVDLTRHQQAFEAASRFINVIDEMTQQLLSLAN